MNQLQLHFRNMNPPAELQIYATAKLEKMLDILPKGSICVALLGVNKSTTDFQFSLDICSKYGPFSVRTVGRDPREAIDRSLKKTQEKLLRWTKGSSVPGLSALTGFFPCRKIGNT